MNNRSFFITILIVLLVLAGFIIKHHEDLRQKMVLAGQTRTALRTMMLDLAQARERSIRNVPADGAWHARIAFDSLFEGQLSYVVYQGRLFRISNGHPKVIADHISDLLVRRQRTSPDIVEVQVEVKNNISLVSNIKVRVTH